MLTFSEPSIHGMHYVHIFFLMFLFFLLNEYSILHSSKYWHFIFFGALKVAVKANCCLLTLYLVVVIKSIYPISISLLLPDRFPFFGNTVFLAFTHLIDLVCQVDIKAQQWLLCHSR